MLKRTVTTILAAAMLLGANVYANEQQNDSLKTGSIKFSFEKDDENFIPIFADYPCGENTDEFYELKYERSDIPIKNAGKGLYISGNNHSDDLFMGYYKELNGFEPNKAYTFDISFKLATNVEGGFIGIGGSPGSSVFVKCGAVSQKPERAKSDLNTYRLNLDKGNQGSDGKDMKIVGTIEKQESLSPHNYEFNTYNTSLEVSADENGKIFLIIGTDSGFEGTTSYYIGDTKIKWSQKTSLSPDEQFSQYIKDAVAIGITENKEYNWNDTASRLQFCEFTYNMVNTVRELPKAKLDKNPFDDTVNSKINDLAFSGIIMGKGNRTFAPDDKITREEAAVILCRVAKYANLDLPEVNPDISYSDNVEISEWAISSVYSLKVLNIVTDDSEEMFNPKAAYTQKETLTSLMKLYNYIKKAL